MIRVRNLFFVSLLSLCFHSMPLWASGNASDVARGKRLFMQSCASCHDPTGAERRAGPGLKGFYRSHSAHVRDEQVKSILLQGKGAMPAFHSLTGTDTGALIAYLRTL